MTEPSAPPVDPSEPDAGRSPLGSRDHGEQPIAALMDKLGLRAQDLVRASTEQVTFKMIQRARKGRRLNPHVMVKVRNALNSANSANDGEGTYALADLFSYARERRAGGDRVAEGDPTE